MENDWKKFRLRVNIKSSIETIYKAWATPQGLESWFLRNAQFKNTEDNAIDKDSYLKEGDTYEWFWHGYPDSVCEKGKVLKSNGKNIFSFTFSMGCPVTISIYKESDECIVELVESDLPADEKTRLQHFVGDSRGWIFYLTNLKSVLEGGLDLRNRKNELTDEITA